MNSERRKSHLNNSDSDESDSDLANSKLIGNIHEIDIVSSDISDWIMIVIGIMGSIGSGTVFPVMMLFFNDIIDSFTGYETLGCFNTTFPPNETITIDLFDQMVQQAIHLCILGGASIILGYLQVAFWMMTAERQTRVLRKKLFSAILRQDIAWFDCYKDGSLNNRLTDDVNKFKDGINDKCGSAIQFTSTFVSAITISFIKGWKLTLIILGVSPFLFVSALIFTRMANILTRNELGSYAKAGAVAEEVISAIRTVFAFNGSQKEHQRYEKSLEDARKAGIKKAIFTGLMFGSFWLINQLSYAVGFWFGWVLSEKDAITGYQEYTLGKILLVFFSIIMAVFALGNAGPFIGNISVAKGAAHKIFEIIDRKPTIDTQDTSGLNPLIDFPDGLIGNVEFVDVEFNYPSRENIKILDKLSLKIRAGQTVALVGASGSGKSTCIQLIQRFYDTLGGSVLIDGKDIKTFNLNWLRTQLGVVNQEPVLFGTTIMENIRFGRENVTENEIVQATKAANAHNFIMNLPKRYDTLVGDRGSQLSGGQKQRIAIARALVRNPKILLLDEATSALDNQSESIVQAALDQARLGRTTIVVAHRLSTIRNADLIYVMDQGKLAEVGTHDDLMKRGDIYYKLVTTQQSGEEKNINETNKAREIAEIQEIEEIIIKEKLGHDQKDVDIKKEKEKAPKADLKRVFLLNKPEWIYIIIGCLASIVSGGIQPAFAIVFSKVFGVYSICERDEQKKQIILYCGLFVAFGFVTLFSNFFQNFMFGLSGENLTKRIRSTAFKTILSQEIGWFDHPENNVGTLTTRLAVEAASIQGATGIRIGTVLMNVANLGLGLFLAFFYNWPITLVVISFLPIMVIGGIMQTKVLTGFSGKDKEILEEAGKMSNEAITNIRTVAILNKEKYFSDAYSEKIDIPFKGSMKSANIFGLMLGVTNSVIFLTLAAGFVLGGYLIENNLYNLNVERLMIVFNCFIFGAQSAGQAATLMPDYTKAKLSMVKIFELFDRVPKIDNWNSNTGTTLDSIDGQIEFKSVDFSYPTRNEVKVLDNFNITIKQGQNIALVGGSGCGKSTVTQLLERYYDVDSGAVEINNHNIKSLNLNWLRSQIGIVSQEPVLFDTTIAENIAYGDNSREVSMNEIQEAARKANIHDFISKLPMGYNTNVGSKGTQLSGGQKQRISIARALVKNPRILLLDEATSALDTESEKVVQEALERAQEGRTCIVIAHRLSTIRNSDLIFIIENGKVTEVGTHDQLMTLNGFYAKLNKKSDSTTNITRI